MSDYCEISDRELMERLENGEMQTNSNLCVELMRRMEEKGTHYSNTPEDKERWKADIAASARRGPFK